MTIAAPKFHTKPALAAIAAATAAVVCVRYITPPPHRHIVWQSVHHLQLLQCDLVNLVHNIQRWNIHAAKEPDFEHIRRGAGGEEEYMSEDC